MTTTIAKGFNVDARFMAEATYGTLVATGHTYLPILSENVTRSYNKIINRDLGVGHTMQVPWINGAEACQGTIDIPLDYDNTTTIPLTLALGTNAGGIITPDDELTASYSIVLEKTNKRVQLTGGMINVLRIRGDAQTQKVIASCDWIFAKMAISDTALVADTITSSEYLKMSDMQFRIGDCTGALAAGDDLRITNFEIVVNNNLLTNLYASQETGVGGSFIVQPIRQAKREITFSFTTTRYDNSDEVAAIQTAFAANSALQATLVFDGALTNNLVTIELPEMYVADEPTPNFTSEDLLTFSPKHVCCKNVNNQTYMGEVDYDIRVTVVT